MMARGPCLALLVLVLGLLLRASTASGIGPSETASRPNIVLILADDMGFECLGANGSETYTTPNLDRLAKTGVRFTHCYSQPLCTPSRVKIMTGRYNSRNYIRFGLLDPNAKTFAPSPARRGLCHVRRRKVAARRRFRRSQTFRLRPVLPVAVDAPAQPVRQSGA